VSVAHVLHPINEFHLVAVLHLDLGPGDVSDGVAVRGCQTLDYIQYSEDGGVKHQDGQERTEDRRRDRILTVSRENYASHNNSGQTKHDDKKQANRSTGGIHGMLVLESSGALELGRAGHGVLVHRYLLLDRGMEQQYKDVHCDDRLSTNLFIINYFVKFCNKLAYS